MFARDVEGLLTRYLVAASVIFAAVCVDGPRARAAAQQGQPVFRTSTDHVTLDVVVTDSRDRAVTDLTKDDFVITERGVRQQIADFSLVSISAGTRRIDLDAATAPPADVATNAISSVQSRAMAIVVDDTILSTADIVPIKRTLAALLSSVAPGDQVALTYIRQSDLGQDFTNDSGKLIKAVNRLNAAMGLPGVAGGEMEARDFLTVLDNVTSTLSGAKQSRRFIVLVSFRGCNPHQLLTPSKTGAGVSAVCKGVIDKANETGVPIYGLDPTGELLEGVMSDRGSLATLAVATGGRAYRSAEPVKSAVALMADNSNYYLLGYYPKPARDDGRFQEVNVRVIRPGLQVRARRGYTAPSGQIVASSPHRAMSVALSAGLPDPGLPIRAFVAPMRDIGRNKVRCIVTIEVSYPTAAQGDRTFKDDWRVGIMALDTDGKVKASLQRPVNFTGIWRSESSGTFLINETIDLPAQLLNLRIGVTSAALRQTGSVHVGVDVSDFRKAGVVASPIVLGAAMEDVHLALGLDRLAPLLPFQPTTMRTFSTTQTVRLFSRAFWKTPDRDAEATITVLGVNGSVVVWSGRLTGVTSSAGVSEATLDRPVALGGFPPGDYVLQVLWGQSKSASPLLTVPIVISR